MEQRGPGHNCLTLVIASQTLSALGQDEPQHGEVPAISCNYTTREDEASPPREKTR